MWDHHVRSPLVRATSNKQALIQNKKTFLVKATAGFQCHAIQNRSKLKIKTILQIKSRIWEMKGGKYTKTLAKIWVEGIIRIRDIRGNVLPKFIELCMETPYWSSSRWAPTWRKETDRNICYPVLIQKREFTPRGKFVWKLDWKLVFSCSNTPWK